jgi:alanine-glyoxylate transaminase / serine-glyoxylate transaminase / serine-pyruvate transaminase
LGALAGKVWRIGLMGYSSRPENIELCLTALAEVLGEGRVAVDGPGAVAAARAALEAAPAPPAGALAEHGAAVS